SCSAWHNLIFWYLFPDMVGATKGVIHLIYDHKRTGAKEMIMARFTERDVLKGKPARSSRLRMLVNRATGSPAALRLEDQ
ncbi:MAG: hypothetical protein NTV80_22745, partial [Verrucomicrobia bacterium]|nr:hypothetical protein [Verrucomicrobiota bacterium]